VRWGLGDVTPVLYNLRNLTRTLAAGKDVYIVEGEADVVALRKAGVRATCNPGGAGKWRPEYSAVFADSSSRVIVVMDWDPAGQAHALAVADSLAAVGVNVEFRRARTGKDTRDHLSAGHQVAELVHVAHEELRALAARAADADREQRISQLVEGLREREEAQRRYYVQREAGRLAEPPRTTLAEMLEVPREPRPQLIAGLHGQGHNSGLTAQFKTGKTTLYANLLGSLADGYPFLGRFPVEPLSGNVALFNYEMDSDELLDWLEALDIGDPGRVFVYNLRGSRLSLANDIHAELIRDWLKEHSIEAWLLDPRRRAMRGFGEENNNDHVDAFTDTLDRIKAEAGVPNCFVTAHTGRVKHELGEEHARGATSWDDWQDNRWILTRDAEGNRFFRAEGRLATVDEFALSYDSITRAVTATEQSRSGLAVQKVLSAVETYVRQNPGCSQRNVQDDVTGKKEVLVRALGELAKQDRIRIDKTNQGHRHYPGGGES
jgi:5S rRNA maturation endonuclease (ribonuclease M5)